MDAWEAKTILIVEDDLVTYEYFSIILRNTGVRILHAQNGVQAIDLCREDPHPDLVLMDIQLPVMDGYTATRKIKGLNSDIPVVAQTAYAMAEDKLKSREAGCDDYLSKPILKEDLMKILEKYFGKKG
jgi:CheY-like chemotaxis protein